MRFLQITGTSTLLFATYALAQSIRIASPTPGEVLRIGRPFTVEVDLPNQLTGTEQVSVVLGLQTCGPNPCPVVDDDQIMGQILYAGSYSPQSHEMHKPPYQNFTFDLANNEQPQSAMIHVAHFFLLAAGPSALLEIKNVSVTLS